MNSKMIKQLLPTLSLLLLLVGCSGEQSAIEAELPVVPGDERVPLSVQSAGIEAEVTPSTRAGTPLTSGSIGIFLTGTGYTPLSNKQYNYGSSAWTPNDVSNTIYLGSLNANVCAYYPHEAGSMVINGFTLTSQVYAADKELFYATDQSVNGSKTGSPNRNVTFDLVRAYSRVKVVVKRHATNYPGTCAVTALKLKNILGSTTLNIRDGEQGSSNSVVGNEVSAASFSTTLAAGEQTEKDFLMVPCGFVSTTVNGTSSCGLTIELTVDSRTMTTGILTGTLGEIELGKQYTITVTINGTQLGVDGVNEAPDWDTSGGEINGGDALPVPTPTP